MTHIRHCLAGWLFAQGLQALAGGALFTFLLLQPAHQPTDTPLAVAARLTLFWLAPAAALAAPAAWAIRCCPQAWLRVGSAAALLPLAVVFTLGQNWLAAWLALALLTPFLRAAGDRLMPQAALAAGWDVGAFQCWRLAFQAGWFGAGIYLAGALQGDLDLPGLPRTLLVVFGCWTLAALLNLIVSFPHLPEEPFVPQVWPPVALARQGRETIACWVVLAGVMVLAGAFWASGFISLQGDPAVPPLPWTFWLVMGAFFGLLGAAVQEHPRRRLGYAPFALSWAVLVLLLAAFTGPGYFAGVALAGLLSLAAAPLFGNLLHDLPPATRALRLMVSPALLAGGFLLGAWSVPDPLPAHWPWLLGLLALLLAVLAWRWFLREAGECVLELMMFLMYRLRGRGPGLAAVPRHGPLLVIANHSSWFDPVWLGKVLPRRLIPMMTSQFYDLPVMRWMMVHMAEAIRVEAATFRRDVPELAQAVATLDKGECLVLFPEGFLRRKDHQFLRNFGQGVWHILKERPLTPVVVCWIEGGWGSYCSYFNGPPTKNKKMDFRRPVEVAVTLPQLIPAEVLADHRQTRTFLMEKCLQARGLLGLPVPRASEVPDDNPKTPEPAGEPGG